MNPRFAPIAIFAYKRPIHTERLLYSLRTNTEHLASPIFVYCDGPRAASDTDLVRRTRKVVHDLIPRHANVIERTTNAGLANSIIGGVTDLTQRHGSVIVLEDDLVLSPFALRYFNEALDRYREAERAMHISGYMFPVEAPLPETFFYREATCWGWATWARAWDKFESDGKKIRDYILSHDMQFEFDVRGSMGFLKMLEAQIAGNVDSWAIRWYGSMRMAGGLSLHPGRSLVRNLGFDGTGEHCSETSVFEVPLSDQPLTQFVDDVTESEEAVAAMIAYRHAIWSAKPTLAERVKRSLRLLAGRS